jgi:hypothetical protein
MLRLLGLTIVVLSAACGAAPSAPDPSDRPSTSTDQDRPTDASGPGAPAAPGEDRAAGSYRHFAINHVLSTGQENAVANDAAPPITTAQPYANLKFDSGVMTARACDAQGCKHYAKPSRFVPLVEGDAYFGYGVETMSSGLANEVSKLARDTYLVGASTPAHDILVSLHGRSGSPFASLREGGSPAGGAGYMAPFTEGMMQVSDAMAIAKASGKTYAVRAVTSLHGESDEDAVAGSSAGMIAWQKDYEAGVTAITGQTLPVPLFMLQASSGSSHRARIATSQLDAHVQAPGKVVVVTPGYAIGYATDCVHYTNHQQRQIGEYFGKAYARVVLAGKRWEPLRPQRVTLQGNVVTAQFLVPKPPLVIDTELVKDPGHFGFEFFDDSAAPPAITNVAVVSPDTVAITLAAVPIGNDRRLRYALTARPTSCPGPGAGARGNLRDSDATASNYGYELYNWSVHFDEPVL